VTLKQPYLSAVLLHSLRRIEHQRALPSSAVFFLGRPRFYWAGCISRSRSRWTLVLLEAGLCQYSDESRSIRIRFPLHPSEKAADSLIRYFGEDCQDLFRRL